jgi:hypothetical protein
MNRIRKAAEARRARFEQYRNSIHYAITHASSESERNELIDLAIQQGVLV